MEEEHDKKITSLMARRKKSSGGISCCFSGNSQHHQRHRGGSFDASSYSSTHNHSPRIRSPTSWFKSRTNDFAPDNIKGKCRSFISRMARHRRHSSDFSYDPLSYALNFDDDAPNNSVDDEFRTSFTARLPVSPPRGRTALSFDDDHNLPRTLLSRSAEAAAERWKRDQEGTAMEEAAAGSRDDLRRGFEALSVSIKKSSAKEPAAVAGQRNNKSLEADQEPTSPVGISNSNREILVQLC